MVSCKRIFVAQNLSYSVTLKNTLLEFGDEMCKKEASATRRRTTSCMAQLSLERAERHSSRDMAKAEQCNDEPVMSMQAMSSSVDSSSKALAPKAPERRMLEESDVMEPDPIEAVEEADTTPSVEATTAAPSGSQCFQPCPLQATQGKPKWADQEDEPEGTETSLFLWQVTEAPATTRSIQPSLQPTTPPMVQDAPSMLMEAQLGAGASSSTQHLWQHRAMAAPPSATTAAPQPSTPAVPAAVPASSSWESWTQLRWQLRPSVTTAAPTVMMPAPRPAVPPAPAAAVQIPQLVVPLPMLDDGATTLMIRNVPMQYSQVDLIEELNMAGWEAHYDFLFLAMNARRDTNRTMAFVNFRSHDLALAFARDFANHQWRRHHVAGAHCVQADVQGRVANLTRWQANGGHRGQRQLPFSSP